MLNPFNYTLAQLSKAVASALYLIGILVMLIFFNDADIGIVQALVAIVPPLFGVIAVFGAKNATPDDLQKALEQLKFTALSFIGYFVAVPSTTAEKLVLLIGGIVTAFTVYKSSNEPAPPDLA